MQTLEIFYEGNRELLSLLHCHIDGDFGEERGGGGGNSCKLCKPSNALEKRPLLLG